MAMVLLGALAGVVAIGPAPAVAATPNATASAGPTLPSADPFYSYSGSLAGIAPGTVLRSRPLTVVDFGLSTPFRAVQVLYRTTGERGQPTVTVASVISPLAPLGAPKLVSYQMAYDALGSQCDPSYTMQGGNLSYTDNAAEENLAAAYVALGDTVVVPDYEGVGLDWAAGQESGYGTLDGVRAAENALGLAPATTPVGLIGYSGGSIATDFATELAPTYAPGLDIVAAAEGGLPVDFPHNLAYVNGSHDWSGIIPAVLVALGRAFAVDLEQYLNPYGLQLAAAVKDECINSFLGAYPGLTYQKLLKPQYQDIYAIPVFARLSNHLMMGATGTPREPLFLGVGNADGTGDGIMVARDVQALAHAYCQRGVSVQFTQYRGLTHIEAVVPFELGALTFLTTRLNGLAVRDGCSGIGPGNALDPLPVPAAAPRLERLELRSVRARRGSARVAVTLATSSGVIGRLELSLHHGRRLLGAASVPRVTAAPRRVVLHLRHRLRAGVYTLTIKQGGRTLIRRRLGIS